MAEVGGYLLPNELYYHKEHMWARVEGEEVTVGVTDFYQQLAGEISYLELPSVGDEMGQDDVIGPVETGKWVGKAYAPLSGTVMEVNQALEDESTLPNSDPYGQGWLMKIKASDLSEIANLHYGQAAVFWQEEEIRKHPK
jgi:glycine cleavage system H protein